MEFEAALKIVNGVIAWTKGVDYDGIIVKKLEASNTLDSGRSTNQTHIAISGEQMNMFPYLMADGYFKCDYEARDEQLKKYFITQIPMRIYKMNVDALLDSFSNDDFEYNSENYMTVRACVVRGRRKGQSDQVQLSLITVDDNGFIAFRRLLHTGDFLVILKRRNKLEYDCFGIRKDNDSLIDFPLLALNNKFYKLPASTVVDVENLTGGRENGSPRITGATNILLYGVPGTGKSYTIKKKYCADEQFIERVVFHPDYTYSDFVGQILPRIVDGTLKYVFTPGPFTRVLGKAESDPHHMYYLIIEEINRGNAPAIFGEIFQLLDRKSEDDGYDQSEIGESEYGISNYEVAGEVYKDENRQVKLPSNMTILATMNTADQNIFTLDTAFQRRWEMEHINNDVMSAKHAVQKIIGTNITWGAFVASINDLIIEINSDNIGSEDKRLGAYFIKQSELAVDRFPEKVLKYLWDDAFKMDRNSVFQEKYKSMEMVINTYKASAEDKLAAVLQLDVYNKMLNER